MSNPYWDNVCAIAERQRAKGIATYGQGIEKNPADVVTRVEYLQEELVDALMYFEWIKDSIKYAIPVVHGRWIEVCNRFVCSECKERALLHFGGIGHCLSNYCPNCGARMDGDGDV